MSEVYIPRRVPESVELTIRGLRCHLTRWIGADTRPVVLLHGFMDAGDTFQFLVDAMPDARSYVAPDLRGFGRSEWPVDGYWFPDYFADLDAVLDATSPDAPVVLVGHSMGGSIVMTYAGLRPERVRAVVNIEGFGLPRTRPEQAPERYRTWLRQLRDPPINPSFPSVDALAQLLRRRNPRLPPARAVFIARAWTEPAQDGGVRLRFDPAHKRINPVLYRREESIACWREVTAPVLYVVAGASEYLPKLAGEAHPENMARIVRRLEWCWMPDATHMVHHEQPEQLAEVIEAFLQRIS